MNDDPERKPRSAPGTNAYQGADVDTPFKPPLSETLFNLICQRRGWTPETMLDFNDHAYDRLQDMDRIVELLHGIKQRGDLLVILPDFDMDGITSGTLGFAGLSELGFNVALYIPDHARGHGFGPYDIERILDQYPDAKAVITCDTGIDSHAGIDHGVRAGLTMMITDHHLEIERPSAGTNYLAAHVVIDPVKIGETYKHGRICGAHVLYQVLVSYATAHDRDKLDEISLLRLFAGIGTVSDVMPVLWENRRLVSDSLAVARLLHVQPDKDTEGNPVMPDVSQSTLMLLLSHRPHHPRYVAAFDGMARVIAHFAVAGKIRDVDSIDEGFYGFYLAPAFNAIRRMGTPMEEAFGAFFADAAGKDARIASIIATNDQRKELVKELFSGMMERDQPFAPHVYLVDAVKGMLGLLANKVMEHNGGIPSVVLGDHGDHSLPYSGSARAPGWYAFNSALNAAGFHSAGHEQAFGTKVADYADIARLRDFIEADVAAVRAAMMASPDYVEPSPDLLLGSFPNCDADFYDVEEMVELALRIESFAPFGHDFKEPVVEVMVDVADCRLDLIGEKKNHLRVALPSGIKCLLWDSEALYYDLVDAKDEPLDADRVLHMAGKLRTNTYMGNTTANFMMDAIAIGSR